ncbi:hypothetical protein MtrunA17_Chr7g0231641 [Medicago truncatula]|uniref:Uncharacterized protein n=1 Tax=Medicago truncatula TaxID=3880 RepID=A0A396H3H3_MEDTR|nr:hypothetical protein MtrunA17_Chr7g0231641 [Medicago truncatula]
MVGAKLISSLFEYCLQSFFKNGVYIMLVKDAGDAFGRSRFVKIDCKGLDPGDYKKLGSKHKNDFACVKVLIWEFYGYWFAKICVIHGVYACWLRKCHMRASNGYLFLQALFLSSSGTLTKSCC